MHNEYLPFFRQYLRQMYSDIEAYKDESKIWIHPAGISNSAGNLCYHLVGNLNHFIGQGLGHTGYVRNREEEFGIRDVPKTRLLEMITDTESMLENVLPQIADFTAPYPSGYFPEDNSIQFVINRLAAHLGYHVGQVNYHRRLLDA
ncbi:MAG: DUF1572 family protein [Lewinellaceae bacterium]|nr:DUF1572 family protein [Lewinella sp.]MCB9280379.1 DUF1572 family protein [Lewinellaceae bacterium]